MAELIRAVKGMNDILPPDSARWEWLEDRIRALMQRYGYLNVRTPIVEPTALFVRGLGDRYTQTSLNGARIPSPEPEKKVVPLDLFPAGLLQTITTVKTFTPDQPGDFSGAQVDISVWNTPGSNCPAAMPATMQRNTHTVR